MDQNNLPIWTDYFLYMAVPPSVEIRRGIVDDMDVVSFRLKKNNEIGIEFYYHNSFECPSRGPKILNSILAKLDQYITESHSNEWVYNLQIKSKYKSFWG